METQNKNQLVPFNSKQYPFSINTEFNLIGTTLFISYKLHGNISNIDFEKAESKKHRIIGLWEKTCFELFLKNTKGNYLEFNFSSVFEWNCFYFKQKGDQLKEYEDFKDNHISFDLLRSLETFMLIAKIDITAFPDGFLELGNMEAGITTITKFKDNSKEYWALSHEDTRPNFHHFKSFRYMF